MSGILLNATSNRIPLAGKSVHSICTSPPYFGLRAYAGQQETDWPAGIYSPMIGVPACVEVLGYKDYAEYLACEHEFIQPRTWSGHHPGQVEQTKWKNAVAAGAGGNVGAKICLRCGAMRCSFGNEPTPEAYVWHSLLVLRECHRVLRDDGVLWWVIGDSYMSAKGRYSQHGQTISDGEPRGLPESKIDGRSSGWTDGQLMGIPYRVMLAAQADGWTARNDVVWEKVAPMPESVDGWRWEHHRVKIGAAKGAGKQKTNLGRQAAQNGGIDKAEWEDCLGCDECIPNDGLVLRFGSWRHTRAHETVLMLTKGTGYWGNRETVKESQESKGGKFSNNTHAARREIISGGDVSDYHDTGFRNPRSVVSPRPYSFKGEHYAAYPPSLVEPLIRATTPEKCCPICGQGWSPVIEKKRDERDDEGRTHGIAEQRLSSPGAPPEKGWETETRVIEYRQTCDCEPHEPVSGIVFDPFMGTGTTGQVATSIGLDFIGTDISYKYLHDIATVRVQTPLGERISSREVFDKRPVQAQMF